MNKWKDSIQALLYAVVMIAATVLLANALAGCTVVKERGEAYADATEAFINPDKIVACYKRDGENRTGFEARCFGEGCQLPECPK